MAAENTAESEYSKIRDSTVGVERIKLLLEREESSKGGGRQMKSLKSGYTEVIVPDTN
jgi:hypothetical protein